MALIGQISIAMSTNTTMLKKGLNTARHDVAAFASSVNTLLLGSAGLGLGYAFVAATKSAIGLGEQVSRVKNQFGEFSGDVIKQANTMATAFGVDRKEFLASSAGFAMIFEGANYSAEAVEQLSTRFAAFGQDLSSNVDIPVAEAMAKLQSGLAGNVRPLRDLGINMTEAELDAYAAAHGIGALGKELSEQEKTQARVGFIMTRGQKIINDLARTADEGANSVRALGGRFEELKQSVGGAILSVIGPAMTELNVALQATQTAWDNSAIAAQNASMNTVTGIQGQVESMGWLQKSIGYVADMWQVVGLGFDVVQSYLTEGWASFIGLLSTGLQFIDIAIEKLTGTSYGLGMTLKEVSKDLHELSKKQWEGFQHDLAKPPSSEGINTFFDQARSKIKEARIEALKLNNVDVTKLKPMASAVKSEMKFADAMEAGSQEATNTILRSKYGGGGDKSSAKIGENTKATADHTKGMLDILRNSGFAATGGQTVWQDFG